MVLVAGLALHRGSVLYDTDSYYHLAVARAYAEEGLIDDLRWTRMSVMHRGFGDKEILFHLLLAPFAALGDAGAPLGGGRWALALLGALAAAVVAGVAARAIGWWAALLPAALAFGSTEMAWRAVRLRPELLALPLLVAALYCLGTARYRLAGLVGLAFTLAYTAWHALAGLVVLVFLYRALGRRSPAARTPRRWPWPMLLYPLAGIGLGLVVHPHFPHNLEVWVVQTFEFFRLKGALDVGSEIRPNFTDVMLMVNLGWLLALAVVWRSTVPMRGLEVGEDDEALADAFGVAAVVFVALYLLMSRFSLYAVPLVSLWTLLELRRRGLRIGPRTRLPGGRSVPLGLALGLCLLVGLPEAWRQARTYRQRTTTEVEARLADRRARAAALPAGARVAADWGDTATMMLWAPQARYLNALDPAFMAVPYPQAHRALRAVLDGAAPDVPLVVATTLDSEYLLVPRTAGYPRLTARLAADPRAILLQRGSQDLYRLVPRPPGHFLLDWRQVPAGSPVPLPAATEVERWPPYPRLAGPAGALEAYVDAARLPAVDTVGCRRLVTTVAASALPLAARGETPNRTRRPPLRPEDGAQLLEPEGRHLSTARRAVGAADFYHGLLGLELAPAGPTRLWRDGASGPAIGGELGATLGRGLRFELPADGREHRLEVETCPTADGSVGFYLARTDEPPGEVGAARTSP